jgi:hypothetical protein
MVPTTQINPLYIRFFDIAKSNFDIAKILVHENYIASALYNLEQSFEKSLKALHIHRSMTVSNLSEKQAYDKAFKFSHNIEKSAIDLLIEIGEFDKNKFQKSMELTTNPELIQKLQISITAIDKYLTSAKDLPNKLGLDRDFIANIRNYDTHVRKYYDKYTNINMEVNKLGSFNFLRLVNSVAGLYACLYRMDTITRYPSENFNYENIELLGNEKNACIMIAEILDSLITLVSNEINSK